MAAGYSGKNLIDKLGVKLGMEMVILNAPNGYDQTLGNLPDGVKISKSLQPSSWIQYFVTQRFKLESDFPKLKQILSKDGALWISWPKKSSGIVSDLDENIVMKIGLENGLVDIKVIAVDETWSGLKFVYRLKDR